MMPSIRLLNKFDDINITTITVYELLIGIEYSGGKGRNYVEEIINLTMLNFSGHEYVSVF